MFRRSYAHHQEDHIVHAILYGTFFMHLSSSRCYSLRSSANDTSLGLHFTVSVNNLADISVLEVAKSN